MSSRGREGKTHQEHTQARGCEPGPPPRPQTGLLAAAQHTAGHTAGLCWSSAGAPALSARPQGPAQGPGAGSARPGPPQGPEGGEGDKKQPAPEARAGRWGGSAGSRLDSRPRGPRGPRRWQTQAWEGRSLFWARGRPLGEAAALALRDEQAQATLGHGGRQARAPSAPGWDQRGSRRPEAPTGFVLDPLGLSSAKPRSQAPRTACPQPQGHAAGRAPASQGGPCPPRRKGSEGPAASSHGAPHSQRGLPGRGGVPAAWPHRAPAPLPRQRLSGPAGA